MLTGTRDDRQVPDIIQRIEITGRFDPDTVLSGIDTTRIHDPVLGIESTGDISRRNATAGHYGRTDGHIDCRRPASIYFNFSHIFDLQQFVLDPFGLVFQLTIRIAIPGQAVKHAQDISEIVIHNGCPGPCG